LADDHEIFRAGLRSLLDRESDMLVVGEAPDGRLAVEMALALRPDVVVMDVAMPHLNGIEATRQILEGAPNTRVLVLSAHCDPEYVEHVTSLGAAGYVTKQTSPDQLATAIRTTCAGKTYVSPSIPWGDWSRARGTPTAPDDSSKPVQLTSRETEVLQLIAEGFGNKQIARELGISVKTVEKHRQGLMTKLGIHDIAGLTQYAIASGAVECGPGRLPY
jgi:DNA-binding NarL/FixJ family response regulator